MKKLTPGVGLRHLARFHQTVRLLSLASAYVLLLGLAAPAWPGEKYVKSDSPVFLEVTPDRALVYFVDPGSQGFGTVKVYLDKTPIGFLPRKSYIGVRVEPGHRLVWGTTDGEWFEFKRGRTYLLVYLQSKYVSAWFMDNPDIIRPSVLQKKLAHVMTPEAGLERLRAKLENKYKKALKQAGSKGGVVLPKRFLSVTYMAKGTRKELLKTLFTSPLPSRSGTLTIGEQKIEYKSKKKEVVIPVTEIRQVSLATSVGHSWIVVRYGRAEPLNTAFFSSNTAIPPYSNSYNAIFASIMSAMEQAKRTDVQKEPATATVFPPEPSKPERQTSATAAFPSRAFEIKNGSVEMQGGLLGSRDEVMLWMALANKTEQTVWAEVAFRLPGSGERLRGFKKIRKKSSQKYRWPLPKIAWDTEA